MAPTLAPWRRGGVGKGEPAVAELKHLDALRKWAESGNFPGVKAQCAVKDCGVALAKVFIERFQEAQSPLDILADMEKVIQQRGIERPSVGTVQEYRLSTTR